MFRTCLKNIFSRVLSDFLTSARRDEEAVAVALQRRGATKRYETIARTRRDMSKYAQILRRFSSAYRRGSAFVVDFLSCSYLAYIAVKDISETGSVLNNNQQYGTYLLRLYRRPGFGGRVSVGLHHPPIGSKEKCQLNRS